jgi:tripartite-type tricarboxylate transporter receptor subunit TctC
MRKRTIAAMALLPTTDILARLIGHELSRAWGQPIVIENKAGATGSIAAAYVAKSRPDGYTLLMGSVSSLGSGFPGFDASAWFGLVGPAGIPGELTHKVANEVAQSAKWARLVKAIGVKMD